MHKPIIVRDKTGEREIDLYPEGDPRLAEANRQRLAQITQQPEIYISDRSRTHTAEATNAKDRAKALLLLGTGVLLINLPISVGIAWAAAWGVSGWACFFGVIQLCGCYYLYRTQLDHSPAGIERQRQTLDHELRMQQQTDAHELRSKVVDHMLDQREQRQHQPSQPQLFVNSKNQLQGGDQ